MEVNPRRKPKGLGQSQPHLEKSRTGRASGAWENKIASVLDLLDTQLDPKKIEKARDVQMATLVEKSLPFQGSNAKCPANRNSSITNGWMKSKEARTAAGSHV